MFKRSLLLLALIALVSCDNTNNPPSPALPEVSASESALPESTPSPSESETPSADPTPEPSTTPLPTQSPQPTATPLPTPAPVFGSEEGAVPVTFKARIITASDSVFPVAESKFDAYPYALNEIKADLAKSNGVEDKPLPPQFDTSTYTSAEKVCSSSGCSTVKRVDYERYNKDLKHYEDTILPEWEARAYEGYQDIIEEASDDHIPLHFSTDKNGSARLRLPPGKWYFNGRYSYEDEGSTQTVIWEDVAFEILNSTTSIELTR